MAADFMDRKTVLVTGGSGGIGQAIAKAFAARGHWVAVHYCGNQAGAQAACEAITQKGGRALAFPADLSHEEEVDRLFTGVEARLGPVGILINNAGIAWQGLLTDMTLDQWRQVLDVNLTSAFLCCRRALPGMIRAKSGCIVNVSSMWGQRGASCEAAYSAAKAGLIGLTQALALEEGPSGVRVNCVAPGVIDTPINARLGPEALAELKEETPLLRLGTPEDVAKAAVYLSEAEFVTGQVLGVNGGFIL